MFVIVFRNIDQMVRQSQQPMTNALMLSRVGKRRAEEVTDADDGKVGAQKRGKKKVRRTFKEHSEEKNLVELSYKKFAPESKKKIRWAVNMYDQWRRERSSAGYVPVQIANCNLKAIFTFEQR